VSPPVLVRLGETTLPESGSSIVSWLLLREGELSTYGDSRERERADCAAKRVRLLEVERRRGVENLWKLKEEVECGEIEVGRAEEAFILYGV
jgi:hypothetical protein